MGEEQFLSQAEVDALLRAVSEEGRSSEPRPNPGPVAVEAPPEESFAVPSPSARSSPVAKHGRPSALDLDVPFTLSVRLGAARLTVHEICDLRVGSTLRLDRLVDEPVPLAVRDVVLARGQVVVVDDHYGLRVSALGPESSRPKR